MSKLEITLDEPAQSFVAEQVGSGAYADADAVVRAALAMLRADAEEEARKEARFNALVQEGLDELDRGEGIEVEDVGAWLATLGPRPAA